MQDRDSFDRLHDHGIDLKRRRVFLQGGLDPDDDLAGAADQTILNLLWLDAENHNPIELWIDCPGGSLDKMWAVFDALRMAESKVDTVAIGNVSSAACLLLAAGTGTRWASPNASFMWHGGWQGAELSPGEFRQRAEWYERDTKRWLEAMARLTKPPNCRSLASRVAFWELRTHDSEFWLTAPEMKAHGIVDELWGP